MVDNWIYKNMYVTAYVYCRYTNGINDIQDGLNRLYSSIQKLVDEEEFKIHVIHDPYTCNMDNIIKKFEQHKIDSMKNECPIVFAGKQFFYQ